jgi:hypothetical protein
MREEARPRNEQGGTQGAGREPSISTNQSRIPHVPRPLTNRGARSLAAASPPRRRATHCVPAALVRQHDVVRPLVIPQVQAVALAGVAAVHE